MFLFGDGAKNSPIEVRKEVQAGSVATREKYWREDFSTSFDSKIACRKNRGNEERKKFARLFVVVY